MSDNQPISLFKLRSSSVKERPCEASCHWIFC